MTDKVEVNLDEVKRVYKMVEDMHNFFHQPMNFPMVDEFAKEHYKELKDIYYDVMWDWLPEKVQREFEES
jgi:hypothetical protein